MRDRFRTFDSRISFFAFADIITAVSGMLIFITLLLATDLGRPTDSAAQAAEAEIERKLDATLAAQAEADARNHRLQELLAVAETAPDSEKLQADIARLRAQLAEEQRRQTSLASQKAETQTAAEARDRLLGLDDLKAGIQRMTLEAEAAAGRETKARNEMAALEQQASRLEGRLLKMKAMDGQLWLIPDKSASGKEPILVTVARSGATIELFDRPEKRRPLDTPGAGPGFKAYLREAKSPRQYVVFLVRPSGIGLFQDLVQSARDAGFEVGFDALEEDRQIHFSSPPPTGESTPPDGSGTPPAAAKSPAATGASGFPSNATPAPASSTTGKRPSPAVPSGPAVPPKRKSWWQRLLEWVGLG